MIIIGLRGAMLELSTRRHIPTLLYADIMCLISQIGFNAYSTYLLYADPIACSTTNITTTSDTDRTNMAEGTNATKTTTVEDEPVVDGIYSGMVWSTWAIIIGLILFIVITFNLFPGHHSRSWERRFYCLGLMFCCSGEMNKTYSKAGYSSDDSSDNNGEGEGRRKTQAARLADLFTFMSGQVDATPSDLLCAFILAMTMQRFLRRRKVAVTPLSSSSLRTTSVPFAAKISLTGTTTDLATDSDSNGNTHSTTKTGDGITTISSNSSSNKDGDASGPGDVEMGRLLPGESSLPIPQLERPPTELEERGGGSAGGNGLAVDGAIIKQAAHYMTFAFASYGWMLYVWDKGLLGTGCLELFCVHPSLSCLNSILALFSRLGKKKKKKKKKREDDSSSQGEGDVSKVRPNIIGNNNFTSYSTTRVSIKRMRSMTNQRRNVVTSANSQAILQTVPSHISQDDIVFLRLEKEVLGVLPYYIAVDHVAREVIIAIRGSLSLDDVVTDLMFEPADLGEWVRGDKAWGAPIPEVHILHHHHHHHDNDHNNNNERYAAHAGILEAARATLRDIIQINGDILHPSSFSPSSSPTSMHAGYKLVLTGHSLGAGCAYLIGLYLKQFFPDLTCWAFSPPGGLVTASLAATTSDWCTSVVVGRDCIPRLTVNTFDKMKTEMLYAAVRCKQPKAIVLTGWLLGWRWREEELFWPPSRLTPELKDVLQYYEESLKESQSMAMNMEIARRFVPPGRLIWLKPVGAKIVVVDEEEEKKGGGEGGNVKREGRAAGPPPTKASNNNNKKKKNTKVMNEYKAVWADSAALVRGGVHFSARMMADHMPDYVLAALRCMANGEGVGGEGTAVVSYGPEEAYINMNE